MASHQIDALTQALSRLPGLGPRSARRVVLHLMEEGADGAQLAVLETHTQVAAQTTKFLARSLLGD